jgi:hypothetical protein
MRMFFLERKGILRILFHVPASLSLSMVMLLSSCKPQTAGVVLLAPTSENLGLVDLHGAVSGSFKILNKTPGAVAINAVVPGCGCTVADLDKKVIQSGESSTVKFTIKAERAGRKTIDIRVDTSLGALKYLGLIEVLEHANWVLSTPTLALPDSAVGVEASHEVTIRARTDKSLKVTGALIDNPLLSLNLTYESGVAVLKVTKLKDAPEGLLTAKINVTTTDPQSENIVIPVFTVVHSGIFLTPSQLIVARSKANEEAGLDVTVGGWKGSKPSLEVDGADIANVESTSPGLLAFKISFRSPAKNEASKRLKLIKDGAVVKEYTILFVANNERD